MAGPQRAPLRILCAGMVGSGSTFLYNVAREILLCDPGLSTLATYADEWNPAFGNRHHLLIKSHWGLRSLAPLAERGTLRTIGSVRHPGDCICSDMERFGFDFDFAAKRVAFSLKFISALRPLEDTLIVRYEDRFASGTATTATLARLFGIRVGADRLAAISQTYSAAATRDYADKLQTLPKVLRSPDNAEDFWCPTTQIHRGHIGKLRSGRWLELPDAQRRAIAELCAEDAAAFGYDFPP